MDDKTNSSEPTAPEDIDAAVESAVESETPAAPKKVRLRLVPNRHDRRRSTAIRRREKQGNK